MTEQHPITPPHDLLDKWNNLPLSTGAEEIFVIAARWGADAELQACELYLAQSPYPSWAKDLRETRRPKPPSLKEQALRELNDTYDKDNIDHDTYHTIRRALEALPND